LALVWPILGIGHQAGADWIHPDGFCFFRSGLKIPQTVVEEIPLQLN